MVRVVPDVVFEEAGFKIIKFNNLWAQGYLLIYNGNVLEHSESIELLKHIIFEATILYADPDNYVKIKYNLMIPEVPKEVPQVPVTRFMIIGRMMNKTNRGW